MLKVLDKECQPTKGSKYSACIDLKSRIDVIIGAGETIMIPLGVKIDSEYILNMHTSQMLPDNDALDEFVSTHYLQLMLRSSLGKNGLIIPNGVGVIDLDYEDEIMMIIYNSNRENYHIEKGDRIAQITLLKHYGYLFDINTEKERKGGFGSSGR
jgi:deoxyuridine 5'-triphosphate nucleotidohydrolase